MPATRHNPTPLRLVRSDDAAGPGRGAGSASIRTTQQVRRENRAAAISRDDRRAVFAAHVVRQLDGGRAAILTPDRRRGLLTLAERMGMRLFDANLVIAIVQDAVREGDDPLDTPADARIGLVSTRDDGRHTARRLLLWWCGSMLLGIALFAGLIAWTVA